MLNPQVRQDGLGAQATAKQNGTFDDDSLLWRLPKLAQLVIRTVAQRMRGSKQKQVQEVVQASAERQRELRKQKRDDLIKQQQTDFGNATVH